MRHLLAFFVLGGLCFAVKRELAVLLHEAPALVVTVPQQASAPEVE